MVIKAIIFDCFGVLTADQWHEFRLQLPREEQSAASELNQRFCSGEIPEATISNESCRADKPFGR